MQIDVVFLFEPLHTSIHTHMYMYIVPCLTRSVISFVISSAISTPTCVISLVFYRSGLMIFLFMTYIAVRVGDIFRLVAISFGFCASLAVIFRIPMFPGKISWNILMLHIPLSVGDIPLLCWFNPYHLNYSWPFRKVRCAHRPWWPCRTLGRHLELVITGGPGVHSIN